MTTTQPPLTADDLASLPEELAAHVRDLRAFIGTGPTVANSLDALVAALIGARGRAQAAQRALESRTDSPLRDAVVALLNAKAENAPDFGAERYWLEHLSAVKR